MAIITIISAKGCGEELILKSLSSRLNFDLITDEQVLRRTSQKFQISENKLQKAIYNPSSLFLTTQLELIRLINCYKITILRFVLNDNLVYSGFGVYTLPGSVNHILRVCIGGDLKFRIDTLMKENSFTSKEAEQYLRKYDKSLFSFVNQLQMKSPWNSGLFDIVVSADKHTTEEMVDMIYRHSQAEMLKKTDISINILRDSLVSALLMNSLLEKKHDVDIKINDGIVKVYVKKYKIRMESYIEKIRDLVNEEINNKTIVDLNEKFMFENIKRVDVTIGTEIEIPSPIMPLEIKRQEKILLVDDETEFVDALSERLMSRNFKTSVAYSGEEALDSLSKDLPDVIILDLKMPGIDGIEVLRRVKKEHHNTEVIILTGHGSDKEKEIALELGAFAYLEKPVNINLLSETMQKAYENLKNRDR